MNYVQNQIPHSPSHGRTLTSLEPPNQKQDKRPVTVLKSLNSGDQHVEKTKHRCTVGTAGAAPNVQLLRLCTMATVCMERGQVEQASADSLYKICNRSVKVIMSSSGTGDGAVAISVIENYSTKNDACLGYSDACAALFSWFLGISSMCL